MRDGEKGSKCYLIGGCGGAGAAVGGWLWR